MLETKNKDGDEKNEKNRRKKLRMKLGQTQAMKQPNWIMRKEREDNDQKIEWTVYVRKC